MDLQITLTLLNILIGFTMGIVSVFTVLLFWSRLDTISQKVQKQADITEKIKRTSIPEEFTF